jgi:thioredoxin 1
MNNKKFRDLFIFLGGLGLLLWGANLQAASFAEVPVKGLVNLVDLGSEFCLPCKMMAPVLKKVEKSFKGKAAVTYIDIDKFPDQIKRFGVRVIPTQIFYDRQGKEVYRHMGFLSEKEILAKFKEMGVN